MTIAPPTPSRPATNAPTNPSASRVRANASVTGSAPNLVGPALAQARVVRREIPDLVVRDRLHQRFERLERLIRGVPAVGLEQEHLVPEIAGGCPRRSGLPFAASPLPDSPWQIAHCLDAARPRSMAAASGLIAVGWRAWPVK